MTNTPGIHIVNSRITNLFKITFEHNYTPLRSPAEREAVEIIARNCTFTRKQPSLDPVHIVVNTLSTIDKPIGFLNNSILDLSRTGATHKLNAIPLFSSYDSYHFAEVGDSNDRLARWDTASPQHRFPFTGMITPCPRLRAGNTLTQTRFNSELQLRQILSPFWNCLTNLRKLKMQTHLHAPLPTNTFGTRCSTLSSRKARYT